MLSLVVVINNFLEIGLILLSWIDLVIRLVVIFLIVVILLFELVVVDVFKLGVME